MEERVNVGLSEKGTNHRSGQMLVRLMGNPKGAPKEAAQEKTCFSTTRRGGQAPTPKANLDNTKVANSSPCFRTCTRADRYTDRQRKEAHNCSMLHTLIAVLRGFSWGSVAAVSNPDNLSQAALHADAILIPGACHEVDCSQSHCGNCVGEIRRATGCRRST